jgi:Na+-driven multidrug efflux pump
MRNYLGVVRRASPIFLSSIGLIAMAMTDTFICARMGYDVLTAQSFASFIYFTEFMFIAAFIHPISNIGMIDSSNKLSIFKCGLLMGVGLSASIVILNFLMGAYLSEAYLTLEARAVFLRYFHLISFSLIFGSFFMFFRIISCTQKKQIKITKDICIAFVANIIIDLFAWKMADSEVTAVGIIAAGTGFVFLYLSFRINSMLSCEISIFSLMKAKASKGSLKKILAISTPASLTTLGEYLFFTTIGFFITKHSYQISGAYRIMVQVEELAILFIYSLTLILSIDISKYLDEGKGLSLIKRNFKMLSATIVLLSVLLYLLYPTIIYVFNLQNMADVISRELACALFLSETLMMIVLAPFGGLAKNKVILIIVLATNWALIVPLAYSISLDELSKYILLLILNYCAISIVACLVLKFKYGHAFKMAGQKKVES